MYLTGYDEGDNIVSPCRENLQRGPSDRGSVTNYPKTVLDVSSSYPNTEDILNISKETTLRELCRIRGIEDNVQRAAGINLTGGHVNAVEICNNILAFPDMEVLLKQYQLDRVQKEAA